MLNNLLVEIVNGVTYEKDSLTGGIHVDNYIASSPKLKLTKEVLPDILTANKGRENIILVFPGYKEKHVSTFMQGHTIQNLVKKLDYTIGFVPWINTIHIEELVACAVADWIKQNKFKSIKLIGTSYGGYFALKLASHLLKLKTEGFSIPIKTIVAIVSPLSKNCVKRAIWLDPELLVGMGHLAVSAVVKKLTGRQLPEPSIIKGKRSHAVRLRTISKNPFKKGEFPKNLPIFYFTTDISGNVDRLVNQPLSIEKLKEAGVNVIVRAFKAGGLGHVIHREDIPRMNSELLSILNQQHRQ